MTKSSSSLKNKVLRVLDPGRKDRDVLSIQRSGTVEINTSRILNSPTGKKKLRTLRKIAADQDLETA